MNPYLAWLLKDVLPHIATQREAVRVVHRAAKELVRDFETRRREHEERLDALTQSLDDLERLARVLGATDEQITTAIAPRHICEEVPHAPR